MADMSINRPSDDIVNGFRELLQARLGDVCRVGLHGGRFGAMTGDLRPLCDAIRFARPR